MARENHMDAAYRDIWNWLKACFTPRSRHRIRYIDGFGYVAEVREFGGWFTISADGTASYSSDKAVWGRPCKTEAEAGQRVNRNDSSGKIVWKG